MYSYQIVFMGRKLGAIGTRYRIIEKVEAENPDMAIAKLYDRYQDIGIMSIIDTNTNMVIIG